jgi:hypothetical protein
MRNSPNQELNSQPLQWKLRVLTPESPGKSPLLSILFKIIFYLFVCLFCFLAVLGLHYCVDFSQVAESGGYSQEVVR